MSSPNPKSANPNEPGDNQIFKEL